MIDLSIYQVQIGTHDLYDLALGRRFDQEGDPEPTPEALAAALDPAEAQAQSIIRQRFGYLPQEADFLATSTVAGVVYLLSRKPGNTISPEEIDQRRQTFFDMLPAAPGAESRAEVRTYESRLGDWP